VKVYKGRVTNSGSFPGLARASKAGRRRWSLLHISRTIPRSHFLGNAAPIVFHINFQPLVHDSQSRLRGSGVFYNVVQGFLDHEKEVMTLRARRCASGNPSECRTCKEFPQQAGSSVRNCSRRAQTP